LAAMRIEIEPGVRLFVDVDGAGLVPDGATMVERPTVLLLHGGPGFDHSTYKGADAMVLDDVAQVVFYDHRGNGRSDRGTPEQWTLDTWADDVVRLCDALEIVKPVVVGASFGGFVAQRYLARHPDHPSKVVLACTSARLDVEAISTRFTQLGGEAPRARRRTRPCHATRDGARDGRRVATQLDTVRGNTWRQPPPSRRPTRQQPRQSVYPEHHINPSHIRQLAHTASSPTPTS
jgi:pimeloyl-ACP methyl ester carboxylesterase